MLSGSSLSFVLSSHLLSINVPSHLPLILSTPHNFFSYCTAFKVEFLRPYSHPWGQKFVSVSCTNSLSAAVLFICSFLPFFISWCPIRGWNMVMEFNCNIAIITVVMRSFLLIQHSYSPLHAFQHKAPKFLVVASNGDNFLLFILFPWREESVKK